MQSCYSSIHIAKTLSPHSWRDIVSDPDWFKIRQTEKRVVDDSLMPFEKRFLSRKVFSDISVNSKERVENYLCN